MKKLLIGLMFLLTLTSIRATNYTCIGNETIIIPDCVCKGPDCPECPILPNETIIIQNLTLPDLVSPNVTCNFDTVGFSNAIIECNDAKDEMTQQYVQCDSNLTRGRLYENELMQKQNEINSCKSELTKKDEEKNNYLMYGAIGAGIVAYVMYQQKVKPSAELRLGRE